MNWLKRLFSSRASTDAPLDVANESSDEMIDINEARIDAGGGGALGLPEPDTHASPAEEVAGDEATSE